MPFLIKLPQFRTPVSTAANLPTTSNVQGDFRIALDTGSPYIWTNTNSSGSLSDWNLITASDYNQLYGAPLSTGLDIDDTVKAVKAIALNMAILAFEVSIQYSSSIVRMVDGLVNRFKNQDSINTSASTHETFTTDYYHPDNLSETLPTVSLVDSSSSNRTITANGAATMSGNNPLFGNASLYLDGTANTYIQVPDSDDWQLSITSAGGIDANTKLMLHLDNNVTDSETTPKTPTGNNVTFNSSIKKFGSHAVQFTGSTGSNITVPDHADFVLPNTFTIDCWLYFTNISGANSLPGVCGQTQAGGWTNGHYFYIRNNGFWAQNNNTLIANYTWNSGFTTGQWYHFALVRNGSSVFVFINGVSKTLTVGQAIGSSTWENYTGPFVIGDHNSTAVNNDPMHGLIDEFRLSHTARWTSNFTPPTAPYDTGGTTDFTIETWVNPAATDANTFLIGQNGSWKLTLDGTSNKYLKFDITGGSSLTAPVTLAVGQWNHVAIVQFSGLVKIYVNGVLAATASAQAMVNASAVLTIGATDSGANLLNGYIEEVRISNNARFTANFTPSELEYTNDANTKLLIHANKQVVNNMTLVSNLFTANYSPSSARVVVFEEDVSVVEQNTDLTFEVSRDGGTTFTTVLLAKDKEFEAGSLNIYSGTVNLASQPAGNLIVYRIKTYNNKDLKIRGVAVNWIQ